MGGKGYRNRAFSLVACRTRPKSSAVLSGYRRGFLGCQGNRQSRDQPRQQTAHLGPGARMEAELQVADVCAGFWAAIGQLQPDVTHTWRKPVLPPAGGKNPFEFFKKITV